MLLEAPLASACIFMKFEGHRPNTHISMAFEKTKQPRKTCFCPSTSLPLNSGKRCRLRLHFPIHLHMARPSHNIEIQSCTLKHRFGAVQCQIIHLGADQCQNIRLEDLALKLHKIEYFGAGGPFVLALKRLIWRWIWNPVPVFGAGERQGTRSIRGPLKNLVISEIWYTRPTPELNLQQAVDQPKGMQQQIPSQKCFQWAYFGTISRGRAADQNACQTLQNSERAYIWSFRFN